MPMPNETGSQGSSRPGATSAAAHGATRCASQRLMSGMRGVHGIAGRCSGQVPARLRALPHSITQRPARWLNGTQCYTIARAQGTLTLLLVGKWEAPAPTRLCAAADLRPGVAEP